MIPIRDEIKTHRVPVVNYILILVNVAVFLWAYVLNANPDAVYSQYALIPSQIRQGHSDQHVHAFRLGAPAGQHALSLDLWR